MISPHTALGPRVGEEVGPAVGTTLGPRVGEEVGPAVGAFVGGEGTMGISNSGSSRGSIGIRVGAVEGVAVGWWGVGWKKTK